MRRGGIRWQALLGELTNPSGCRFFSMQLRDVDTDVAWSGAFEDGRATGEGALSDTSGNQAEGRFVAGRRDGLWKWRFADGVTKEVTYADGLANGPMEMTFPVGRHIQGHYEHIAMPSGGRPLHRLRMFRHEEDEPACCAGTDRPSPLTSCFQSRFVFVCSTVSQTPDSWRPSVLSLMALDTRQSPSAPSILQASGCPLGRTSRQIQQPETGPGRPPEPGE